MWLYRTTRLVRADTDELVAVVAFLRIFLLSPVWRSLIDSSVEESTDAVCSRLSCCILYENKSTTLGLIVKQGNTTDELFPSYECNL